MEIKKIYTEDLQIAQALIQRDNTITRKYFYHHCFPLFKSIYDNYYTDCTLSLQKNTTQSHKLQNDQGKTMIAKDSFVPLL